MFVQSQGASAPSVFSFDSSKVRIVADDRGDPWFCAADICAVLGYAHPRKAISDHCREKGITKRSTLTTGGAQDLVYINEPNLYRLIIKSRKPEAERFEAWVMEEVLPALRKTGRYEAPSAYQVLPLISGQPGQRFLVSLREHGQYQVQPIPPGCGVMTPVQFLQALIDPNGVIIPLDQTPLLFDAVERLQGMIRARCLAPGAG